MQQLIGKYKEANKFSNKSKFIETNKNNSNIILNKNNNISITDENNISNSFRNNKYNKKTLLTNKNLVKDSYVIDSLIFNNKGKTYIDNIKENNFLYKFVFDSYMFDVLKYLNKYEIFNMSLCSKRFNDRIDCYFLFKNSLKTINISSLTNNNISFTTNSVSNKSTANENTKNNSTIDNFSNSVSLYTNSNNSDIDNTVNNINKKELHYDTKNFFNIKNFMKNKSIKNFENFE